MKTPSKTRLLAFLSAATAFTSLWAGPDWPEIQDIKTQLLEQAAVHAMEQQKSTAAGAIPIALDAGFESTGDLSAEPADSGGLEIRVLAAPKARGTPAQETIRITLPKPTDMLSGHSGLAMVIKTKAGTSPQVRWGVRLIGENGKLAEILPTVPVLDNWGEATHEIYLDWAFINYSDVEQAIEVLESVVALEFTAASALRAPEYGPSREAQPAEFTMSNLRLVDYLRGSYDPNRNDWGWDGRDRKDLTLQHRVQEITGVVAMFGGEAGLDSAIASLDMATRTQCWDGSYLDTRRGANTVASGEYTHGFTLWGLTDGYAHLESIEHPGLDEIVKIGAKTLSRRDHYQRMLYRAAMSRASFLPSEYRDDIIHSNTLVFGANRVLGYAVAMRRAADYLRDKTQRLEVLRHYYPIIEEIEAAQGAFSGGFPILGEGDRYKGKGIHYDSGYTRTHMDWLVQGIRATGDPILVKMLDKYQMVVEAAMDTTGTGILPLISERGHSTSPSKLVLPDATAQVGLQYNLPVMAQWGYNVGMPTWEKWEPGARINHFTWGAHARGYPLGAHISILLFDLEPQPEPVDIGYRFPRQFPIWSSRFYQRDSGDHVRTSRIRIDPDGSIQNDFRIEVGEYLETIGIPVWIESPDASMTVEAVTLDGWPTLLSNDAPLYLEYNDKKLKGSVNQAFKVSLEGVTPVRMTITGPEITLPEVAGGKTVPFRTVFILTPSTRDQDVSMTVRAEWQ